MPGARIVTTATTSSAAIDFQGAEENAIEFQVGVRTDGVTTPSLSDSPDGVTYTAVPAANIVGSLSPLASNVNQKVSYVGPYRWVKAVLTSAGATTGVVVGVNVITKPRRQPAP